MQMSKKTTPSQTFLNIQTLKVRAQLSEALRTLQTGKVTECINIQTGHVVHCDVTKGSIFWYSVCRQDKDMGTQFWNCQSNSPEAFSHRNKD